ncbi:MAG: substrate-binding domain-containing protein [Oscillospiraceae bacterium]|jgi:phosphate transport system substrate-binding protein|nr:substrate-binding domain-containing protein [Oscillospiraceae bacterium]
MKYFVNHRSNRRVAASIALALTLILCAACASGSVAPANSNPIHVISREEGSGTRSAFIELFGVEEKDADGNKIDNTIDQAEVTNNTAVMMTSVSGDPDAIGYISLGSLNDTVKAVKINGVAPSVETVKDGSYTISRPFNIATKDDISPAASEFIAYILSAEGQTVVENSGYIKLDDAPAFTDSKAEGKIVVAGSSSVTPLMEKLSEAFALVNPSIEIEIQQSDSTTGVNSALEGVCDIGMVSRVLKDSEIEKGLTETNIALDGIAVIINKDNALDTLTTDQVKGVYTGTLQKWSDIQ